jgi:hypothetical protein
MNDPTTQAESHTLSVERRVDAACLRFERAWRSGERPRIEDYLTDAPETDRGCSDMSCDGWRQSLPAPPLPTGRGDGTFPGTKFVAS